MQNFNHNIGFREKRQFFRWKLAKIAENCDHNMDPWSNPVLVIPWSLQNGANKPLNKKVKKLGLVHFNAPRERWVIATRVTRLGENSPKGWLFTMVSCSKIRKVATKFVLLFFKCKSYILTLTKNGLGYILGDFFPNSSGHPDRHVCTKIECTKKISRLRVLRWRTQ
jgi:hypothetical protein